jgi:methyl-accepting chemotaxis protein
LKWFLNLTTTTKLITAFILIAVLSAFSGLLGLLQMGKINDSLSNMYDNNLIPVHDISHAAALYQRIRVNIRDMNYMADTKAEKDTYQKKIMEFQQEIDTIISKYNSTDLTSEEKNALQTFNPAWEAYDKLLDEAIRLGYAGDQDGFKELVINGGFKAAGDKLNDVFDNLIALNVQLADQSNKEGNALFASSRTTTIGVIVASILVGVVFGYWIARMIAGRLGRVVDLVRNVAGGDLTQVTDIDTKDEVGQLARSINEMVIGLRSTVGGILVSAESLSAAAQQISASTQEIASGNTSQASAAKSVNELFQELSIAINSVAVSAEQASEISNDALEIAQEGSKVVDSSIDSMKQVNRQVSKLEDDSSKIGEIIEVIDDIAEQTNLLALNAAIEAARAGDQGRGFAVVADEVRKLAERSGEATKQITAIIKGMQENTRQSVRAVGESVVLSEQTGEAFRDIVSKVNESAGRVTEIAAASQEQAAQSSEVMAAVETISAVTEQSAASSEETASTAQSLAELAEELNSSVTIFKIGRSS